MLAQLLGSRLRARAIGWLFTHPDERFYVRQLTKLLGEDSTNLSRELARLHSLGILSCEQDGRQKYYRADPASSLFEDLKGLATKTVGIVDVLRHALDEHREQIEAAFVFGSFARQEQTADSDVDVLIIGGIDPVSLQASVAKAEEALRRTVNYTILSQGEFAKRRNESEGFFASVLKGPKLMLMGALDDD